MSPKTYRSAQYYYVPDTRPTGPAQMRTEDPKRPGGQDAGAPRRPSGKGTRPRAPALRPGLWRCQHPHPEWSAHHMAKNNTTSRDSGGYDPQRYARVIRQARPSTPPEQREPTRQELIELAEKTLWGDD